MKSIVLALSLIVLVQAANGQIQNGGFENWRGNIPDFWVPRIVSGANLASQNANAKSGNYAVRLQVTNQYNGAAVQQTLVNVNVNGDCILTFAYFCTFNGTMLGYSTIEGYREGELWQRDTQGRLLSSSNNWIDFNQDWEPNYEEYDSIHVIIGLEWFMDQPTAGYINVDDVQLTGITSLEVSDDEVLIVPNTYSMVSVYPNPFNGNAMIGYNSSSGSAARLSLYDVNGRLAGTIPVAARNSGRLSWNDFAGSSLPAGNYTILLESAGARSSVQAIYLK